MELCSDGIRNHTQPTQFKINQNFVATPCCSEYPAKRSAVDSEGRAEGVPGKLRLVHEAAVSPQPITAFDWNASQRGLGVCCSFDQTLRVVAVPRSQCIS